MQTISTEPSGPPGIPARYALTKEVVRLPIEGRKRKLLLAAIAAFQDEGHPPSVRELIARTKLGVELRHHKAIRQIDGLLKRLEADGYLRIEWAPADQTGPDPKQRNRYEVILPPP